MFKVNLTEIMEGQDGFRQVQDMIGGEICTLVIPNHIGTKWTKDNLHLRSSIYNSKGELISAGLKKFFNYEEHPEITRQPNSVEPIETFEKLDGSCLIVSRYNNQTIIRTRGQFNTNEMANHHEIETFKTKYKKFYDDIESLESTDYTYIFEWTSPDNVIVVKYAEADIKLLTIISHTDYKMLDSVSVNAFASTYNFKRPRYFRFKSIDELLQSYKEGDLTQFGINDILFEGFCVYYNNGQSIRKCKTAKYLVAHKFRENCDIETVLDIYIENDLKTYQELYNYIEQQYDYECAIMAQNEISKVLDAAKEVAKLIAHMHKFVEDLKALPNRKEQALAINQAYGVTNRGGYVFGLLDGKPINKEGMKKLYFQILKK